MGEAKHPVKMQIASVVTRLYGGTELKVMFRWLTIRAKNMVARPVHRRMIRDLTKAPLSKGTLSGEDATAVFRDSHYHYCVELNARHRLRSP